MKYFDVLAAREAFKKGLNVTEVLRGQHHVTANTPEIIELAYDLQAGSYIESAVSNQEFELRYCRELARIAERYLHDDSTLLDVGTGETTTLSLLARELNTKPRHIFAFDISWSRLFKGLEYANEYMGECLSRFTPFVAEMGEIPLQDHSVSVTVSSHALEPNGGRLRELLNEIFRVTREWVLLFEPCYESNSEEGRKRMDALGYIKDIDTEVAALGGEVVEKVQIKTIANPMNPTTAFIVRPPSNSAARAPSTGRSLEDPMDFFAVPGTSQPLKRNGQFLFSADTGLAYPVLKSIPILRSSAAILASALSP